MAIFGRSVERFSSQVRTPEYDRFHKLTVCKQYNATHNDDLYHDKGPLLPRRCLEQLDCIERMLGHLRLMRHSDSYKDLFIGRQWMSLLRQFYGYSELQCKTLRLSSKFMLWIIQSNGIQWSDNLRTTAIATNEQFHVYSDMNADIT
ncbi:hypothetical protein DdX_11388 [Ditylenchus destructor]|uniref:Uncharacterized protein n=1 Tax=Ditylenchus destructor TaxID=166010 RepID=A0AAD4MXI8_9BILA|nr:hypothetical protein DdX_11388 [Ditylenchus destructor]